MPVPSSRGGEHLVSDELRDLVDALARHPAVLEKARIQNSYAPAETVSGDVRVGDDCAAIPDAASGGHLLFAAEGMLDSFVADDPWFAGYSAVMVNLSDIAAMGGRPIAITNTLWTPDNEQFEQVWQGMRAASEAYGVPIVGGHTTRIAQTSSPRLGASVLGRAGEHLLSSFDAAAGDRLVIVVDMKGAYRGDKPFWNASTSTSPETLKANLDLLPELAERRLCRAAKDISNGGIIGTLGMLCHCSDVGATVDLDRLPRPERTDWLRWLTSFPSYGYILAISEQNLESAIDLFVARDIVAVACGNFTEERGIRLSLGERSERVDF